MAALDDQVRSRNASLQGLEPIREELLSLPLELMPSLIIGPAESYCRAWLSVRVKQSPELYRQALAEAAWRAVGRDG